MRRLYIVGPSSTGKTTLINALARKLDLSGPAVIKEVARTVMTAQGYTRDDVGSLELQKAIMLAQLQREDEGEECPIRISDRSAVDAIVYAILTAVNDEDAKRRKDIMVSSPHFQRALTRYRHSTFILLAPVTDWFVDDGIRLMDHQNQSFDTFKTTLRSLGIQFREIGADMRFLEERIMTVLGLMKM